MKKILFLLLITHNVFSQLDPNITSNPLALADRKLIKPNKYQRCENLSLEDLFKYKDAPPPLKEIFWTDWWGGRVGTKNGLLLKKFALNQQTVFNKEINYAYSSNEQDIFFQSLQDKYFSCIIDVPEQITNQNFGKNNFDLFFSKDEIFLEISQERYNELLKYLYEKYKYIGEKPLGYVFENDKLNIRTVHNSQFFMIIIKKI